MVANELDQRRGESGTSGVACGDCGAMNGSVGEFCTNCGHPLHQKCLGCGGRVANREKYCGKCGADLARLVESRIEGLRECLAESERLAREYRFDEATRVLRRTEKVEHPRLTQLYEQIAARHSELCQRAASHRNSLENGLHKIRDMIDRHAYCEAISSLEKLPASLLQGTAAEMLKLAQDRLAEIKRLQLEVKEAVARKAYLELMPRLERLRVIDPGNQRFEKLSEQVVQRIYSQARQKLAQRDFAEVVKLAAAVPTTAPVKGLDAIFEQARDVEWLRRALDQAPFVDGALEVIAERLAIALPDDRQILQQQTEIRQRRSRREARVAAAPWAASRPKNQIGFPIEWRVGSGRLKPADASVARELSKQPGDYFAAMGLALQGLGRATVDVNLLIEKKSVLGKLARSGRSATGNVAWGIDLGDTSLKAIKLVAQGDGTDPIVADCVHIPHRHHLSRPGSEDERSQVAGQTLSAFVQRSAVAKNEIVCFNLPANQVLSKLLSLPNVAPKKLPPLLINELPHHVPVPLEELSWGYQLLPPPDPASRQLNVLLLAARTFDVQQRMALCAEAGLPLQILQSDAAAIHNYACFDWINDGEGSSNSIGALDVGAETTSLIISSSGTAWFRSLRLGGNDLTTAIARQFQLTTAQAELVKGEPQRAKSLRKRQDAMRPLFRQLEAEIRRSLESYRQETSYEPLRCLICVGGGVRVHGLLSHLVFGE